MLRGMLRAIDRKLKGAKVDRTPSRWPEPESRALEKLGPVELEAYRERLAGREQEKKKEG